MVMVLDIACPRCNETDHVRKVGITSYECTACEMTFTHEDLEPSP